MYCTFNSYIYLRLTYICICGYKCNCVFDVHAQTHGTHRKTNVCIIAHQCAHKYTWKAYTIWGFHSLAVLPAPHWWVNVSGVWAAPVVEMV